MPSASISVAIVTICRVQRPKEGRHTLAARSKKQRRYLDLEGPFFDAPRKPPGFRETKMDEVHEGGILRVEQQAAVPRGAILEVVLSWKFMADDKKIDLDTSCMIFNLAGRQLDCVFYNQLTSRDGSITHSGDHFTANCVGDTEIITIDTSKVHPDAQVIQICKNTI